MAYTKEEARVKIQALVEDFRAQEKMLETAPEAQVEQNFIRPLFRYLNWNTENEGLSPAHYEFKVQVTNRKGLRPDYILNVDGRDVLVMDAKQVKYQMHDPRWLYQVYSYAYSTQNSKPAEKIDFAILTDFQEFIVLDCTLFATKPEAVNNFRVIDWKYSDYVERFDELWELFERNHVMEDSRPNVVASRSSAKQPPVDEGIASGEVVSIRRTEQERGYSTTGAGKDGGKPRPNGLWSRYLSPQKVKANRISPDKAFLAEMDDEKDGWRVLLAKDMKKRNPAADGELITSAVQLLIDRLIFIKALSDREVDRDYLSEIKARVTESGLGADEAGWFTSCKTIFEELNNFYNGSIFAPRPELENVSVSNKAVQAVLTDLQPENSPYNFAVLPVEILGTIYERFLGRVVRTTEKQVKIEEKPEVRKAGGVYYTPQYIVDYIVGNTLGKLLDPDPSPNEEHIRRGGLTPADVAKIKVLDPSCGSGSFLLGAYDYLIEWHKDYFARAGKEKRDRESFYRDESGQIRLTAKLKREILKNNIFGVDIDPQAVEVTRFSLSLKALEDLREGELTEERTLFHQTVLPDLSQNIKNGNSLIGSDYFGLLAPTVDELKEIKPFNWKTEFKDIMDNGGFDAVIGNPPYVRQETLGENFKSYAQKSYSVYAGTADLYVYFIEQSHRLLGENGFFSFIVANKWMRANYGLPLRRWLKQQQIEEITDFGDLPVFESATTYPCILRLSKKASTEKFSVTQVKSLDFQDLNEYVEENHYQVSQLSLPDDGWSLINESKQALFDKLQSVSVPLGKYVGGQMYRGILTGLNEAFVIGKETKEQLIDEHSLSQELIKPFLAGRDVKRYGFVNNERYLIFTRRGVEIKKYPAIYKYLSQYKEQLMPKPKNWKGSEWKGRKSGSYEWYEIQDSIDYYMEFEKPKIIVPAIVQRASYAYDNSGIYTNDKTSIISVDDLYLLGLLNSKVPDFVMHSISSTKQGGYFEYKPMYLEQLPIRAIDFNNPAEASQHEKMVALVSQMLALHKSRAGAKTQAEIDLYERQIQSVDGQIDRLVYELYGLTEEEIRIVEGK